MYISGLVYLYAALSIVLQLDFTSFLLTSRSTPRRIEDYKPLNCFCPSIQKMFRDVGTYESTTAPEIILSKLGGLMSVSVFGQPFSSESTIALQSGCLKLRELHLSGPLILHCHCSSSSILILRAVAYAPSTRRGLHSPYFVIAVRQPLKPQRCLSLAARSSPPSRRPSGSCVHAVIFICANVERGFKSLL